MSDTAQSEQATEPQEASAQVDTAASEGPDGAPVAQRYAHTREGWKGKFVDALSVLPNVRAACDLANVARSTAYKAKGTDPEFSSAWDTAIEEAVDRLEQAAWERATVGTQRIRRTFNKDGTVATETIEDVVSDRLAELLLKAHRPAMYVDRLRIGPDRDTDEVDSEILELARGLTTMARARRAELDAGEQHAPDEADVIEAEVVEEGATDG